jgi:5-methylcytosine-specific restriction endonuclease McrA
MQIGKLVKHHIGQVFSYCETVDHEELARLLDPAYSKNTFGTNFPFCVELDRMEPELHRRYWTRVYLVRGKQVRVTSQWFETSTPLFIEYLVSKGITTKSDLELLDERLAAVPAPTTVRLKKQLSTRTRSDRVNARYRGNAIGNAQNLFVRNVLSNLGYESFSQRDWEATKEYFSHRCAYCGIDADKLVIEHAIPINKVSLGEHRLGNLVPSCKTCNDNKGGKDFREFMGGNAEAIARIEEYMDSRNYVPLEENEQVTMVLDLAHKEVAALADRYVTILNELFVQPGAAPDAQGDATSGE